MDPLQPKAGKPCGALITQAQCCDGKILDRVPLFPRRDDEAFCFSVANKCVGCADRVGKTKARLDAQSIQCREDVIGKVFFAAEQMGTAGNVKGQPIQRRLAFFFRPRHDMW